MVIKMFKNPSNLSQKEKFPTIGLVLHLW